MSILRYPNKSLLTKTKEWDFSISRDELISHAVDMHEALSKSDRGVALAANQVGKNIRMFVIHDEIASSLDIPTAIVNPRITYSSSSKEEAKEGCLSFPNTFVPIKRSSNIGCEFFSVDGFIKHVDLSGFNARVFQHECEHLDGKLFVDNLPRILRYQVISKSLPRVR